MVGFKYEGWAEPDGHCSCTTSIEPCSHGVIERERQGEGETEGREGGRGEGGREREGREGEGETFVPQSGQDQVSVFN